jgi:hypothetical protein
MDKFIIYLKYKTKDELNLELKELYSSFENVRVHYDLKINQRKTTIKKKNLSTYKTKIQEALYPDDEWCCGFDIDEVDRILLLFNSESNIREYFELGLYALEEWNDLVDSYGGAFGDEFYDYFIALYHNIAAQVSKKGLKSTYQARFKKIMEESFEGYDYQDNLMDLYYSHIG